MPGTHTNPLSPQLLQSQPQGNCTQPLNKMVAALFSLIQNGRKHWMLFDGHPLFVMFYQTHHLIFFPFAHSTWHGYYRKGIFFDSSTPLSWLPTTRFFPSRFISTSRFGATFSCHPSFSNVGQDRCRDPVRVSRSTSISAFLRNIIASACDLLFSFPQAQAECCQSPET